MSECPGVQIAAHIFGGISLGFSIAACFIPVQDVEHWINITLWVFGGLNALFAAFTFIVVFLPIRWFFVPKIAIGLVNIAFFAFCLTLSILTVCGTPTLIDDQVQWYFTNNNSFHDWILKSYPDGNLTQFIQEMDIFGIVITGLLVLYSGAACYITLLALLRVGEKRTNSISPIEDEIKVVPMRTATYDHSTITGGYGPLQVYRPVIIMEKGPPVYGTSPAPYVD